MTGGINFTPEAERQLNKLDDWITKRASAAIAQRFVSAILDHIRPSGVPICRPGARRRPTRNADDHLQDQDPRRLRGRRVAGELVVNILGVFHGGEDWEAALGEDRIDPEVSQ